MDPSVTLFAIEAGVKLGKKLNDILVNDTNERPLILPVGDLYGSIQTADANIYFAQHSELTNENGPYANLSDEEKLKAYKTILKIKDESQISDDGAVKILSDLGKFEQFKKGFGQKPVFQQFLGTVVEIGVDYLQTFPSTISDATTRKYIEAFLSGVDETDFSDGDWNEILSEFFVAGLKVFDENVDDIVNDKRVSVVLGGMTASLLKQIENLPADDLIFKKDFLKRAGASLLKGALGAVGQNSELYLGQPEDQSKKLINSVVTDVLNGLAGEENLFSNDSLKVIMKSAMLAVSDNTAALTDNPVLAETIKNSLKAMSESDNLFSQSTVALILQSGLDAIAQNSYTLVDKDNQDRVFIAETITALATAFSDELGNGNLRDLISANQLNTIFKVLLNEVAKNPDVLLGENSSVGEKAVLTQVLTSITASFGSNPAKIATGDGLVELILNLSKIALSNIDQFIKVDNSDPKQNLLYQVLNDAVGSLLSVDDPRNILSRQTLADTLSSVLSTVSDNVDELAPSQNNLVKLVIQKVLNAASDTLKSNINSGNFAYLVSVILSKAETSILNDSDEFKALVINSLRSKI